MSKAKSKRERIEGHLKDRFDFRYNSILAKIEYKDKKTGLKKWIDDYEVNSLVRWLDSVHREDYSPAKLNQTLKSSFTAKYHPIKEYFVELEKKEATTAGTWAIDQLAATVTVNNPDTWKLSLTKWLVASVAQAFVDEIKLRDPKANDCQNQTCIVFTGAQGAFKSTWINNLCPPALYDYLYVGTLNLNPEARDTLIYLAEKFIINLDDQLRNMIKKDNERMKNLVTHPKVSVRRPHALFSDDMQRLANFIGSINGSDFLADDENRRYLPFEIQSIDIEATKAIDINLVWLQAYHLYKTGYRHYWTRDELKTHFGTMAEFRNNSAELELLLTYYDIPANAEYANRFLKVSEILSFLQNFTRDRLSKGELSKALKIVNAQIVSRRRGDMPLKVYALRERTTIEIEDERSKY
ncbi:MAG: VapE family protein [Spirosomataceae bacterium]